MSSCFQILSSDIRKFHYEHQIHRTNMNEHWLNCLYTRVKPALNKNLTCHLLFDIFQTFSNNWIFLEKFYKFFFRDFNLFHLKWTVMEPWSLTIVLVKLDVRSCYQIERIADHWIYNVRSNLTKIPKSSRIDR